MNIYDLDDISLLLAKKEYAFFDSMKSYNLNIIGIRNRDMTPDSFNDTLLLVYRDDSLSLITKQYPITTDPGLYWLKNPMNVKGTGILVPDQYRGAYAIGLHKGYEALVQIKPVRAYRDNNKDDMFDIEGVPIDEGMHGANIHRASKWRMVFKVEKWSAMCQVFAYYKHFNEFMEIVRRSAKKFGNSFTYTLLLERDIVEITDKKILRVAQ